MKNIILREHHNKIKSAGVSALATFLGAIFLVTLALPALAGEPEYLQLKLEVGQALEIEGKWDQKGVLVATDIEELPQPRRPKLRGTISQVDARSKTISMYGLSLKVDDKTEFIESGDKFTFDSLKAGMRLEVSCKIGSDGSWLARKIKARGVKASDKIKGTISRVAVDGKVPDTIEISSPRSLDNVAGDIKIPGIRILLVQETDILGAANFEQWIGEEEFGDLNNSGVDDMTKGIVLNEKFFVSGEYRNNFRSENQFDLNSNLQNDLDESEQDIRVELYGFLEKNVRAFGEFRLKKRILISSEQSNLDSGPYKGEIIQLYFLASDIGGKKVSLKIGRQDYDEPRQWLFDDYLDAVRLSYYGIKSVLLEGAFIYGKESYNPQFRTWQDWYGSIRYYLNRESFAAAYVMTRSDTDEIRKREPVWWGLRYHGQIKKILRPWADLAIIRGEDKHRPLEGRAIDLGITIKAENTPLQPSLTLGYAFGSGDSTNSDAIDHRFRQTAYEDNVDRLGGVTSLSYYGAVLDPELSNLKITTFGVGVQPTLKSSVELVYHKYSQEFADNDIKGSGLVPVPFGSNTDIGWALDAVVGFPKLWHHIKSRLTLGWFNPGQAFEPLFTEMAFLGKLDIKVGF